MTTDGPKTEAEKEATRRRWINLAEIVAVIGLLISGLALWNSYQERAGEESDKASERTQAQAEARTMVLRATADREGGRLALAPADAEQTIQGQQIVFPSALAVAPMETLADPRIEAAWFRRPVLEAVEGDSREDRRLPVAITTRFYRDGALLSDTAIYYLVYRVEGGGLLEGRQLRLRGLSRLQTIAPAAARRRIDALWPGTGR
ncbi:MAG TPA: hypothetical protein VEW04_05275 [Allosphingosinicella sp.]|nr:hypothetical protein [Allosphingosinicella sp.]